MDGQDAVRRFQFDDDGAVHQQVEAESAVQADAPVPEGDPALPLDLVPLLGELVGQANLVGRLEQAGPLAAVHGVGRPDDLPAHFPGALPPHTITYAAPSDLVPGLVESKQTNTASTGSFREYQGNSVV